jgi:hypothetical protein
MAPEIHQVKAFSGITKHKFQDHNQPEEPLSAMHNRYRSKTVKAALVISVNQLAFCTRICILPLYLAPDKYATTLTFSQLFRLQQQRFGLEHAQHDQESLEQSA